MRSSWAVSSPAFYFILLLLLENRALVRCGTRTEFSGGVCVRVLPGMQVVQPATQEYPEEREQRVCLCGEDRVELEERVKVEDRRVRERRGDCGERGTLCRLRSGV